MDTSKFALEIQNLSFSYSIGSKALENISISIRRGEIFGLLGPNGSGKTTLFKILSTAFLPTSGRIEIFGLDLKQNCKKLREQIGMVFQAPSLDKKLTVSENLLLQSSLYGISRKRAKQKTQELLPRIGLSDRAEELVETLSGGMQRRLEIAKSLVHEARLLIMDEPSTGLDPGARIDLWRTIFELKEIGKTILLTTHLMEEAEKCDQLAILNCGELVAQGTPAALKEEIGGDIVQVESKEPAELAEAIRMRFSIPVTVVEGAIRIEKSEGHKFVPQLVEAFPGEIFSVTVGKPTLEDVFIHKTGQKFWQSSSNSPLQRGAGETRGV